jgi:glycosyltransferase involved in cell wall biosynthesis
LQFAPGRIGDILMRLLLVNYEYPPLGGGAANATWFMGREFAADGHQVCVLTSAFRDLRGVAEDDGMRLYRVRSLRKAEHRSNILEMGSFSFAAMLAAHRIATRERIDGCIAFFTIPSGPACLMLERRLGIPYVVSLRGGDVPGLVPELHPVHAMLTPLRRAILREATAVVANAPALAELSMRADPIPVQMVPNGVDAEYFAPAADKPMGAQPFRFLFVGRLREQKNLRFVLEAMKQLAELTPQEFVLDIVGDGPQREEMLRHAGDLGVSDRLLWHGWVGKERLRSLYRSADCFLNPSLYEGMPNTVLEAMACALPVIASDIGGNRDLVIHGRTGFLTPPGKIRQFTEVLRAVAENPPMAREMGAAGRARVVAEFTWRQVARRYADLLQPATSRAAHAV